MNPIRSWKSHQQPIVRYSTNRKPIEPNNDHAFGNSAIDIIKFMDARNTNYFLNAFCKRIVDFKKSQFYDSSVDVENIFRLISYLRRLAT